MNYRLHILILLSMILPFVLRSEVATMEAQKRAVSIIPAPAAMVLKEGSFTVSPSTGVYLNAKSEDAKQAVALFLQTVNAATGYGLKQKGSAGTRAPSGSIVFVLSEKDMSVGPEGYALEVTRKTVTLTAARTRGARAATAGS